MTEPSRTHANVLMVGLDALESTWLRRLMEAGRLPNLARFAEQAAQLSVASDGETLHGSLWPTFASGTGPGTHGVYFWTQWLAEEMRHVRNNHAAFAYEPFWAAAAADGAEVTVVDVPYVPIVRAATVRQVNAWGMHDEMIQESWPDQFGREFRAAIGRHPLGFDTVEPQNMKDKLHMAQELRRGVGLRARMVERYAPGQRLFLTTFGECHKAGHYLAAPEELKPGLTNEDALAKILEPLDEAWPRILRAVGDDCHVFLFALHGIREQMEYSSYANQLLQRALGKAAAAPPPPDLLRRIRELLPDSVHRAIWRRLPARMRAARQGALMSAGADVEHDAVLRVAHDGHPAFRVNLAGRERDGVASEAEGAAVLEALDELGTSLRTPAGERAFVEMLDVHERWRGERTERLPDALLLANPEVKRAPRLLSADGTEFVPGAAEARNGVHNGRGFCFYRQAANSTAAPTRDTVEPADFAPTILGLMGSPAPAWLEGTAFLA